MKTTLTIDDGVMSRLKALAARQGRTMSELVEAALRQFLREQKRRKRTIPNPLPSFDMGGSQVDIANRDELYRVMEGDDVRR